METNEFSTPMLSSHYPKKSEKMIHVPSSHAFASQGFAFLLFFSFLPTYPFSDHPKDAQTNKYAITYKTLNHFRIAKLEYPYFENRDNDRSINFILKITTNYRPFSWPLCGVNLEYYSESTIIRRTPIRLRVHN